MTAYLPETLFAVAIVAGFVDAIAGGGGLITVPSMFLLGVPPTVVLGTNRFQAAVGELTSVMTYWRAKEIDRRSMAQSALGVGVGSLVGTLLAIALSNDLLARIIPVLMGVVLLYAIFSKRMRSDMAVAPKMSVLAYAMVPAVALGFYNGFFGPGTGAFLVASLMLLLGKSLTKRHHQCQAVEFFWQSGFSGLFSDRGQSGSYPRTGHVGGAAYRSVRRKPIGHLSWHAVDPADLYRRHGFDGSQDALVAIRMIRRTAYMSRY